MLKYKNVLLIFLLSIIVITTLVFLNEAVIDIRIKELKLYFQDVDSKETNIDHVRLIMKYKLHKQMYDKLLSQDKADAIEFHINAITERVKKIDSVTYKKYRFITRAALQIINFNRFLLGKEPLKDHDEKKEESNFDIAYYYERNNHYAKALEHYSKAFEDEKGDRKLQANIRLHQGFCESLTGNYQESKTHYKEIIRNHPNEDIAITATVLLRYLEGFQEEYKKIMKSEKNSIEKSKKLATLLAHKDAMDTLEKVEKKASPKERERIEYMKARMYDEMGKTEKSVKTYLKIITKNPESEYAKKANRRVYIMGSRLGKDNAIKKIAKKTNEAIKDKVLDEMVKMEKKIEVKQLPKKKAPIKIATVKKDETLPEDKKEEPKKIELLPQKKEIALIKIKDINVKKVVMRINKKKKEQEKKKRKEEERKRKEKLRRKRELAKKKAADRKRIELELAQKKKAEEEERRKTRFLGQYVTITTDNGDILIGAVIEITGKHYTLMSSIGIFDVEKSKIKNIDIANKEEEKDIKGEGEKEEGEKDIKE